MKNGFTILVGLLILMNVGCAAEPPASMVTPPHSISCDATNVPGNPPPEVVTAIKDMYENFGQNSNDPQKVEKDWNNNISIVRNEHGQAIASGKNYPHSIYWSGQVYQNPVLSNCRMTRWVALTSTTGRAETEHVWDYEEAGSHKHYSNTIRGEMVFGKDPDWKLISGNFYCIAGCT